jgi:glycosyltransferase involved in cell wall biosynthesis
MSKEKKVTVALLTYNRADYLKYAIQGILDQHFTNFELLIMDNHSMDDTVVVIESFNDNRIKHIRHIANIGATENQNAAIRLAKGEYLIITHDDDIMCPDLLSKEVDMLDSDPSILLLSSNCYIMDEKNEIYDIAFKLNKNIIYNKGDYIKQFLNGENYIITPTVMLRTDFIINKNIYYKESGGPANDVLLWATINRYDGKFVILKETLYKYRKHQKQGSKISGLTMLYQLILEMEKCVSGINGFSLNVKRSLLLQTIKNIAQSVDNKEEYHNSLKRIARMEYFRKNLDLLLLIKILYLFPCLLKLYLTIKKKIFRRVKIEKSLYNNGIQKLSGWS